MPPSDVMRENPIERQLGEVVGTLQMTVRGLENLKESLERLADRAAFKGDLEAMRVDMDRQMEGIQDRLDSLDEDLGKKNKELGGQISTLQKWMWTCGGAFAVLLTLLQFIRPAIRITLGQ